MNYKFNNRKKIDCPYCQSKRSFSPIVGLEEDGRFGICDKKNKCSASTGIFPDKEIKFQKIEITRPEPYKILYLEAEECEKIILDQRSNFHKYCIDVLGISKQHLIDWGVGTAHFKGELLTCFVFRNQKGQWCNQKAGMYQLSGKRVKDRKDLPDFKSIPKDIDNRTKYSLPLFGEHLLTEENKDKPVMIVESEKTAVIASWFYKDFVWQGASSASGLSDGSGDTNDKISPLMNRTVYWLCDADIAGRNNSSINNLEKYQIKGGVLDLFPEYPKTDAPDDPHKGYDLADAIAQNIKPDLHRAMGNPRPKKAKDFWYLAKSQLKIEQPRLIHWFEDQGYRSFRKPNGETMVIQLNDKIIKEVDAFSIKQFTRYFIEEKLPEVVIEGQLIRRTKDGDTDVENISKTKGDLLSAMMQGENVYFSKAKFDWLKTFEGEIQQDTQYSSYFFFKNGQIRVGKDLKTGKVQAIQGSYAELENYIWESDIKKAEFELLPDELIECDFSKFLFNVSGKSVEKLSVLMSGIGYLLHRFKNPSYTVSLILGDEGLNMSEKGGRGKGLIMQAVGQLRNVVSIDGKKADFNYPHLYELVNLNTNLVYFDDVHAKFDFRRLFNDLTGTMNVNAKNQKQFSLRFEDAPKIAVSTNYVVEADDESSQRRKLEIEIAPHYHSRFNPADEFKRNFFQQWDAEEWNRFYNIMIRCTGEYFASFQNGKPIISPINTDIHKKRLLQATAKFEGFVEWAEEYLQLNGEYDKKQLKEQFTGIYNDYRETLQQRTFTDYLKKFAQYKGWKTNERPSNGQLLIKFIQSENQ